MKKLIIFSIMAVSMAACRDRDNTVSTVYPVSYPAISFTGSKFVSIPVGGTVPEISATAFDTFLNESCTVVQGPSTVDVNTPGLYFQEFVSKNSRGFRSTSIAYVAVTNVDEAQDLSGSYLCEARGGTANVRELANGLYETDNVGGNPTGPVAVYFVQLDDTTLLFPTQPTDAGEMGFSDVSLINEPDYKAYEYKVINPGYGTGPRLFERQE